MKKSGFTWFYLVLPDPGSGIRGRGFGDSELRTRVARPSELNLPAVSAEDRGFREGGVPALRGCFRRWQQPNLGHRRPVHGLGFVFPSDRCPNTGDRAGFVGEIEFHLWVRLVNFMVQALAFAVFGPVDFWVLRRLASNFAGIKRTFAHIREFKRIICIQFLFLNLCSSTKSNVARSHHERGDQRGAFFAVFEAAVQLLPDGLGEAANRREDGG